ncbi:MAG: RNA degradosome polyphosphate kinase [Candidatus Nanopelagicaceae bacterium]|nr:RNA degradosome polyphosphate kinase [Candidatus Nanopelagicaceae bacterium]
MPKPEQLIDREISWLSFNERVLELAEDTSIPLLERLRYLAIFSNNLDEFFMVRVASILGKIDNEITAANSAGYTPNQLLTAVTDKAKSLAVRQANLFSRGVLPELQNHGIDLIHWNDLREDERSYVTKLFRDRIFPVLTPLAVDPSHPFPYISGLSLNLAVILKDPNSNEESFARVKVPPILSRFIATSSTGSKRFIPLEDVIAIHLQELFPGMLIEDHYTFRVTRNEDLELEEEDSEDLLTSLEQELARRRFGPPVRLEIEEGIDETLLVRLCDELSINRECVFSLATPLDLTDLNRIADLDMPELKFDRFKSRTAASLSEVDYGDPELFFAAIRQGEILLHHPYESFTSSVVQFLQNAAQDPQVLAIKQTLYRTSGDSPIIEALIEAAEAGKQVLAVIEIRARFDEQANVRWARKLEAAGVHVVYGLMNLKTHAKLSLVIRDEANGLRRYCHVGTGNYNPKTARFYEDLGILSADQTLTEDLSKLFNQLSGLAPASTYTRLLVAPRSLRSGLLERIENEISHAKSGRPAGIQFKLNSLLDEEFVDALYRASAAGVKVDLVIRGISSIRPGIKGLSENIMVRSVLGRFLEHSRIYYFVNGGAEEYWIGSSDLMHRNLDRRVESLLRIEKSQHKELLREIFELSLSTETSSWHQIGSEWKRVKQEQDIQEYLMRKYENG